MKLVLLFLVFLSSAFCESSFLSVVDMNADQQNAAGLKTRRLRKQVVRSEVIWPGKVRNSSRSLVEVAAPAEGILYASDLKTGQAVKKGEELGLIDPAILEEYHDLESDWHEATVMLKREAEELQRLQKLDRDGSVSKREIQDSLARHKVWEKKVEILKDHLQWLSNGASLLETAPISLTSQDRGVLESVPEVGQKWVNRGETLYRLRKQGHFEVLVDLYPSIYSQLHRVDKLRVGDVDLSSLRVESGNPPTLVADLQTEDKWLVSGAVVSVTALMAGQKPLLCLRPEELIREGSEALVFLDIGEGHFGLRKVKTGEETSKCIEAISGVDPGEFIVSEGIWQLYLLARGSQGGDHGHAH